MHLCGSLKLRLNRWSVGRFYEKKISHYFIYEPSLLLQHGSVAGPQYVVSNSFDGVSQILSKSLGRSVKVKVSFSKV